MTLDSVHGRRIILAPEIINENLRKMINYDYLTANFNPLMPGGKKMSHILKQA